MRGVIIRFIGLDVMNYHEAIWWAIAGIWVALLIAALLSLRIQAVSTGVKLFWAAFIFFVPLIGMASYASWCLFTADWSFFKPLLNSRSDAVRSVSANPSGNPPH